MSPLKEKSTPANKPFWRSLDELKNSPDFRKFLQSEFPSVADEIASPVSRRSFMTVMGASMALAGLTGCRRPVQKIVPYMSAPEDAILGKPEFYATTMCLGSSAYGLLVECNEGRPTKIEGNELHPSSQGATNAFAQAEILSLYDPDRSRYVTHRGAAREWWDFIQYWKPRHKKYIASKGEGLAILSEPFCSPTLKRMYDEFREMMPKATWVAWDPLSNEHRSKGIETVFGKPYQPVYHFEKAEVILSLDSDFLHLEDENVAHAKGFAKGRRVQSVKDEMNRLYVVESHFTITGGAADHRLAIKNSLIPDFLFALVFELEKHGVQLEVADSIPAPGHSFDQRWLKAVAEDLVLAKGKSLVLAGRNQSPEVHMICALINDALKNTNKTVTYHTNEYGISSDSAQLSSLVKKMSEGAIETLVIIGGDPVYNTPSNLDFLKAFRKVDQTIHLSEYVNETSQASIWHLPKAHFLESWSDAAGVDGTLSVMQPMILPLLGGGSVIEICHFLATGTEENEHSLVRRTWKNFLHGDFEQAWRRTLHDGILVNSVSRAEKVRIDRKKARSSLKEWRPDPSGDGFELVIKPSASVHDGRYGNNGWLQELPNPVTKLAWGNAAIMNPATAAKLGVGNGDHLALSWKGRKVEIPAFLLPGCAEDTIVVETGYGRKGDLRIARGVGTNIYPLQPSLNSWNVQGIKVEPTGSHTTLASTQDHGSMHGRPIIREANLEEYRKHPHFAEEMVEIPHLKSLFKDHKYDEGYQWGMSIDLNTCIGCNACTIACQSENNIPVVGKEQTTNGREMHWIRMDRYFIGDQEDPKMSFQPLACQHCEMAPCEQVCPVAATVHDQEGLNVMVYNRCVGTRYCSNNCPYKARRFNFYNYTNEYPEILKMAMNPDVTVRSRGVMEKCTYCLQRINRAKFAAKQENRTAGDSDLLTACQQVCPTDSIIFGNIIDTKSGVAKARANDRTYKLLEELNTRPRTSFQAKLRNPNPKLASATFSDRQHTDNQISRESH